MIGAISSLSPIPAPPPANGGGRPAATVARTSADGEKPVAGTGRPSTPLLAPASALTAQQAAGGQKQEKAAKGENTPLSDEERAQAESLKKRDREVRAHERAHASAGGQYAGSPSYSYETGPDGRQYAVEGEVPIDSGAIPGDPNATIDKMTIVIKAALAPAEPSGQDRKVAAQAQAELAKARAELASQRREENTSATADDRPPPQSANAVAQGDQSPRPGIARPQAEIAARAYQAAQTVTAMALGAA